MYVRADIGAEAGAPVLAEPADFSRFHVAVDGVEDAAALDHVLRSYSVGSLDGDGGAMVAVDAVRRLAAGAGAAGEEWEAGFAAMLEYARRKGWVSDDGSAIRAHVEWG